MATNFDFGLDGDAMSQEFSGTFLDNFNVSEGFDYGTGQLELEHGTLDQSASSTTPQPLPSIDSYSYTQPSLQYNDTPTVPSITTAHANPSMIKPMLPPSKIIARPAPKEHSAEEWERQRLTFTQLYTTEDKPLKEVMKIMENEYGFRATPRQYKRRIEQWKLDKNVKENDMRVILRKDLKRKREGKNSEFRISGREIEPKKIQRFAQRYKVTEESILEFHVETPCYIDCDTPAPTIEDKDTQHHIVEEVNIPDSTILTSSAVDSDQDRESRIVDTRKTVLNQFLRKLGVPITIDSRFDLSVFKYPPEIDDLSDEKFEILIGHKPEKNSLESRLDVSHTWPHSTKLYRYIGNFPLKRVHQIPRSILLLAFYLLEKSQYNYHLTRGGLGALNQRHIFKHILYCSIVYYCAERGFTISSSFLPDLVLFRSQNIPLFVEFLDSDGSMPPETLEWLKCPSEHIFAASKLCIDDWNKFVERTERELKDLGY